MAEAQRVDCDAYHRFGGDSLAGDLGTFIGLAADPLARVARRERAAIPGLYAVGNDQASMMGGTYPGAGITIGPALTFGYIAGRALAA